MSLNKTPNGERVHIGIFGKRNAGKSSLLNAITNQDIALVSDVLGTTTDPVQKAMEILPIGPVIMIDTAGIDDTGELGQLRVEKTKKVLRKCDIALLAIDAQVGKTEFEEEFIQTFANEKIPYLIVYTKADLVDSFIPDAFYISSQTKQNITELKEKIATLAHGTKNEQKLVADLVETGDVVVLVVPIDSAAPKGRLILPQQQVIRDLLEAGSMPIVCRETEYVTTLQNLKTAPKLVITDSQVFEFVNQHTPKEIALTSFSILMARYKGVLKEAIAACEVLSTIQENDKVLIAEGCTHHRQCDDIGTVKMPKWIEEFTGAKPNFEFSSGTGFSENLEDVKAIVHCGGCMLNAKEMQARKKLAKESNTPMTNYGIAISYLHGILDRCIAPIQHTL